MSCRHKKWGTNTLTLVLTKSSNKSTSITFAWKRLNRYTDELSIVFIGFSSERHFILTFLYELSLQFSKKDFNEKPIFHLDLTRAGSKLSKALTWFPSKVFVRLEFNLTKIRIKIWQILNPVTMRFDLNFDSDLSYSSTGIWLKVHYDTNWD